MAIVNVHSGLLAWKASLLSFGSSADEGKDEHGKDWSRSFDGCAEENVGWDLVDRRFRLRRWWMLSGMMLSSILAGGGLVCLLSALAWWFVVVRLICFSHSVLLRCLYLI